MNITVNCETVELSEAGWLENLDEWTEDVAVEIAKNENIDELTDDHWNIIYEARIYFSENGTVASPREFSKIMKNEYGKDKSTQAYIYKLFPTGLIKCANKVAGLPRPKGCS